MKESNTLSRNNTPPVAPTLDVVAKPPRHRAIHSAPASGYTAQHGFSLAPEHNPHHARGAGAVASPVDRIGENAEVT